MWELLAQSAAGAMRRCCQTISMRHTITHALCHLCIPVVVLTPVPSIQTCCGVGCSDPVERLKLVVAFAVGGFRQQVSCDKPFNPILVSQDCKTLSASSSCSSLACGSIDMGLMLAPPVTRSAADYSANYTSPASTTTKAVTHRRAAVGGMHLRDNTSCC